jgi:RNA polymerase sigma factor (TIGR02999 family)
MTNPAPLTDWLQQAAAGRRTAIGQVFEALYPELRRIAHARLYHQAGVAGLSTTVLVHEAFLRLVAAQSLQVDDRRHFLAYAAKTMRHLIVDLAREHLTQRRGGDLERVTLDTLAAEGLSAPAPDEQVLAVHDALERLGALDAEAAEVVELRYFAGYTEVEIAEVHGVSERTVRRRWDRARLAGGRAGSRAVRAGAGSPPGPPGAPGAPDAPSAAGTAGGDRIRPSAFPVGGRIRCR